MVRMLIGSLTLVGTALADEADGFLETFDAPLVDEDWYLADYINAKTFIATAWDRDMITVAPSGNPDTLGTLTLRLVPNPDPEAEKPFLGGEIQRAGKFGHGDYEVYMQAGQGDGLVSSFFTYTGPPFGDPHDEIDFEILGRDTTRVCLNRYTDGERMARKWVDLPFDSADTPALYRFEWRPDRITWFVDGIQVHELTAAEAPIPSHPSKIMANIWVGGPGQRNWLKSPAPDLQTEARYHCMSYRPTDSTDPMCSDVLHDKSIAR